MLTWPSILCPSSGGYVPFLRSLSGGQSLSGFEQVQPQFHDRWAASFQIAIKTAEQNLAARSLLTQLRGRSGTVGLPLFERIRPPRAADTPGSPIGTSVSNPVFASRLSVYGSPIGTTTVNPVVAVRWPKLEGTAYEYSTVAGLTGSVLIEDINRARFTASGSVQPSAGQYITLDGERRRIISLETDGSDRLLYFFPTINATLADQYTTISGITGTAVIEGANRVKFTPTGTQPAVGQYVTLIAVRRKINGILNDGSDRILQVAPGFTIGSSTPGALTAATAADADLNDTTIDIDFTVGGPPVPGTRFSIGTRLYQADTIEDLGSGVSRCTIWPWLRADVASGTTVNFTTPLCEMRLASDQEGVDALRSLDLLKFGTVSLAFDEASAA